MLGFAISERCDFLQKSLQTSKGPCHASKTSRASGLFIPHQDSKAFLARPAWHPCGSFIGTLGGLPMTEPEEAAPW